MDDHRGKRGCQEDSAAVRPNIVTFQHAAQDDDAGERERAEEGAGKRFHPARGGRRPAVFRRRRRIGDDESEQHTNEKAERVGVRAVVNAAGIAARCAIDKHGHCHRGRHRQDENDDGRNLQPVLALPAPAMTPYRERDKQERPQDVELLLDGQRPVVPSDVFPGICEVAGGLGDLDPVIGKQRGAKELRSEIDVDVGPHQPRDRHGDDQDGQRFGNDAPQASDPEILQRDAPRRPELTHQKGGDEESRKDEKDIDAQEPASQPAGKGVENHDR